MKKSILSVVVLLALLAIGMFVPSDVPADIPGGPDCDCTGSPVTVNVCKPKSCPGSAQDLNVVLVDVTCNKVVGSCTISASSTCCSFQNVCSNHTFRVDYGPAFGSVCSTANFTPSTNPYTVSINCTCP